MAAAVAHLDMDAFFASVELQRRPELRGKPVVVANNRSRSVVAAATYEARRFGVSSAMPLASARRRCPELIAVPADMDSYREISAQAMSLLGNYSDRVEIAGLDEAYLDLSGSRTPKARARQLKADVTAATGLGCSIGLGPNKLIAKIASALEKPDAFCALTAEEFRRRTAEKPARLIPGVGPRTAERLAAAGIATVGDLATTDRARLAAALGPAATELADRARGIDLRPLETEREPKSESRERTFGEDVTDLAVLESELSVLAGDVAAGTATRGLCGRTVTIKVRLAPFETHTRSRTLAAPVSGAEELARIGAELLREFSPQAPVRLIGIALAGLAPAAAAPEPLTLFPRRI